MSHNNSWDFFSLEDRCDIDNCSLVVLIVSVVCSGFLLLVFIMIRRRIIRSRSHRIQIKKGPQKNFSEISIFPRKNEAKNAKALNDVKAKANKKKKTDNVEIVSKGEKSYIQPKASKREVKKDQVVQKKTTKKPSICVSERPSNKFNNFIDEPKQVLSENLRVEYFEDPNTDITTIPKERRMAGNVSGLSFLNFSNNGDLSEKNFENFMKLKNKKRMFDNDDSIEFEDVDNIDMNHSDKGSFRIENKLEIKNEEEGVNEFEPKITRNSEPIDNNLDKNGNENNNYGNVLRDLENDAEFNPYLEEGFQVRKLVEVEEVKEKRNDGLEIVKEVNEESDRENKK